MILALDLEGTLVSNAMSQIPRPGLYRFLDLCNEHFPRVVLFTAVRRPLALEVVKRLVEDGFAPPWFANIEYIDWSGPYKDLTRFVGEGCLLVDDLEGYVAPGQQGSWLRIQNFESPYPSDDVELQRVWAELEARIL